MNDDKGKPEENQSSKPLFETVPIESIPANNQQAEEISPEVLSPEDAPNDSSFQPEIAPSDQPLVYEESKMKYVLIAFTVLFFIGIFILVIRFFSGARSKTPTKDINLVYWGLWEEKEIIDSLINEYQKKNPHVKIAYEKKSPTDYREKLVSWSQKSIGPDIFRFHNTWLPELKSVTAPIPASIMKNSEFEKTFFPIIQKDLKIGQYYYGIPLYIDGLVLIYNESMFKKAGINKPPANWDELVEYVGKLQVTNKDKEIITSGIAIGTASNIEHFSEIFGLMLLLNGGSLGNLDQPESAGALEAYRRFAELPNPTWNEAMPNSITAFAQEKVAMIIAPSWEILSINAISKDIKMKVIPIPKPPGGKQVSLASYWVEGVSSTSKNQLEAWKFLKFLSQKESMTKLFELENKQRLFGEPYSRIDLAQTIIQNPYLGPVIQQAIDDSYVSLPIVSRTYDNGLNDEIRVYLENAINATISGVSYSDALNTAQKGVTQVFQKYKIQ